MVNSFTDKRLRKTPLADAKLQSMESYQAGLRQKSGKGSVAQPSISYKRMEAWWDVIEAVRGGTSKVRELGEAYLPKEPGEKDSSYKRRLSRVVLTPWYARLVRGLVGMVLRKPITLEGDELREKDLKVLGKQLEDVNLQGDNLQTFAKDVFESAIDFNYSGILVEYPNTSEIKSLADEIAAGVRPYWVLYPATDILGMKYQQMGSQRKLTQVRLKQRITEDVGDFGEQEIEQVLVYDLDGGQVRWRIYREDETKAEEIEWYLHDEGMLTLNEIPFAVCYTDKKCRVELQPPMLEIAYLNIKHYQLSADLDHGLHVASMPRMFIFGAEPEDVGELDSIDEAVCIPNAEARVEWSSAKLDSFAAVQSRISETEDQMVTLGLSTLTTPKNVGESAEAKRLDRVQGDSIMAVVAQSLQNALNMAIYYHLQYLGIQGVATCQVSRDFDVSQMEPQMIAALYQIRQGGDLTRETFLELLKRGEIGLPDDWDPEEEIQRIEAVKAEQTAPQLPPISETDGMQPQAMTPNPATQSLN